MKKKMRKYGDGGVTEGQNPRIDDETRTRAMKFVEDASEESRDIGAPVTRSASKTSSKVSQTSAPAKKDKETPVPESKEEYTDRMEGLTKKQALERVEPEDYIPGTGLLKNIAKRGLKTIGADTVKQLENNATKKLGFDKAGDLAKKRAARAETRDTEMKVNNAKNYGIDPSKPGSMSAIKALRKDIGDGKFSMKKGGSVKSSQMSKANGIAQRGLTRGKMC